MSEANYRRLVLARCAIFLVVELRPPARAKKGSFRPWSLLCTPAMSSGDVLRNGKRLASHGTLRGWPLGVPLVIGHQARSGVTSVFTLATDLPDWLAGAKHQRRRLQAPAEHI